jgi:DNA-binding GntR family transcriptional regulator
MGHLSDGMQATLWENLEKRILKRKIDFTQHYQEHIDIFNAIKDKNKNLSRERMASHLNNLRKGLFNEDYL